MFKYFEGWRKKTGLAFLLFALMALCLWMRSIQTVDVLKADQDLFVSSSGSIIWDKRQWGTGAVAGGAISTVWAGSPMVPALTLYSSPNVGGYLRSFWQFEVYGIGFGEYHDRGVLHVFWALPYWSIVLTFCLFSILMLRDKRAKNANINPYA